MHFRFPMTRRPHGENYCSIKDCHNVPGKIGRFGKAVKLHEIPKKKALRAVWLRAISRKNFNPKRTQVQYSSITSQRSALAVYRSLLSRTKVCSDHFPDGNGRTWEHQIPTIFLPQKIQNWGDKLVLDNESSIGTPNKKGAKRKLRLQDEFLLVMMRLRFGLLLKDLEYKFKVSAGRISRTFTVLIRHMCRCFLPKLEDMNATPKCFENFKDTIIIFDCTEIFVQTPSFFHTQSQTYSHYKGHNTFKALVGIDKVGAVVFVSRLWGGSVSDTQITRKSGLYDLLEESDAVMVDKGLYCPPFLTKSQFSKKEVVITRRITSARIHVERKMEQIKNFRILQGVLPLSLCDISDEIFFVCAALTNLLPALVK
ncbi:hypothetical protein FSP39_015763 [Pinctada imbricata]|uniref:THAP-type domain-containing protein n=1 Tax=Pinctada imbricata TaxID=66713 RepID=A0AA88YRJ2_PINIB|nr:hypothetical protein FSP39_015763 [Pinctada imbricata]